jgi:hypothetical protein
VPTLVGFQTSQSQRKWSDNGFKTNVDFNPRVPPQFPVGHQTQIPGALLPCDTTQIQVTP